MTCVPLNTCNSISVNQVKKSFGCWLIETAPHLILVKWNSQIWTVDHLKHPYSRFWPSDMVQNDVLIKWNDKLTCWSSEIENVDHLKWLQNVLVKWYWKCWSSDIPTCWSSDTSRCWSSENFPLVYRSCAFIHPLSILILLSIYPP